MTPLAVVKRDERTYDGQLVNDAPDDETATVPLSYLGTLGNVATT